jgi:hypothetical protein
MDPITTTMLAALARLSETVIKDSYDGLKAIIIRKVGKDSDLTKAVDHLEKKPDSAGRAQTLTEEIAAAKVNQDEELLTAARLLQEMLKSRGDAGQTIQQTVTGNQNIFSATGDVTVRS